MAYVREVSCLRLVAGRGRRRVGHADPLFVVGAALRARVGVEDLADGGSHRIGRFREPSDRSAPECVKLQGTSMTDRPARSTLIVIAASSA